MVEGLFLLHVKIDFITCYVAFNPLLFLHYKKPFLHFTSKVKTLRLFCHSECIGFKVRKSYTVFEQKQIEKYLLGLILS